MTLRKGGRKTDEGQRKVLGEKRAVGVGRSAWREIRRVDVSWAAGDALCETRENWHGKDEVRGVRVGEEVMSVWGRVDGGGGAGEQIWGGPAS